MTLISAIFINLMLIIFSGGVQANSELSCSINNLNFVQVNEAPSSFPLVSGKVRPGKTAIFQFKGLQANCSPLQAEVFINQNHSLGHSEQSTTQNNPADEGIYNSLFSLTNPVSITCNTQSICTFNLTAPNQTGFFRVDIKIGTKEFHNIPFEVSCSDGIYCNGAEQYVAGQCQVPFSSDVIAPCNQKANTGSATGGCDADSCTCFRCDEVKKECSQFPEKALQGVTQTTDIFTSYTNNCGNGDYRNYCNYACVPDCGTKAKPRVCGSDGCGGVCGTNNGTCTQAGYSCNSAGQCVQASNAAGTCNNPIPLFDAANLVSPGGFNAPAPKFAPLTVGGTLFDLTKDATGKAVKVPPAGIELTIFGDNTNGATDVTPTCNTPGVPKIIYKFTVTKAQGFEAVILAANGDPAVADTVMALHGGPAPTGDCRTTYSNGVPSDIFCSDDATPPGGFGSHVYGALVPGDYYLVASSYAAQAKGPYRIIVKFTDGSGKAGGNGANICRPNQCVNRACGVDGCRYAFSGTQDNPIFIDPLTQVAYSGTCGYKSCDAGFLCNDATGQCKSASCPADPNDPNYAFDCKNRQCGYDGGNCGHLCGSCADNKACNFATNQCVPVKPCDSNAPVCPGGKQAKNTYCGYDCEWHKTNEPLIDLIPSGELEVSPTIQFQHYDLPSSALVSSCAVREGCLLNFAGTHYLMRFTTNGHNIGPVGFKPGSTRKRPDLFEFSDCHGHFHFEGFAAFNLLDASGFISGDFQPVVNGGKLSYCMEDTLQYQFSPKIGCNGVSTCDDQGIQPGWTDKYPSDLDCQWLDLSNLVAQNSATNPVLNKWYTYQVCVNTDRNFVESSYENNCREFLVYLPNELTNSSFNYADYMNIPTNKTAACTNNTQLNSLLATGKYSMPCVCTNTCAVPLTNEGFQP